MNPAESRVLFHRDDPTSAILARTRQLPYALVLALLTACPGGPGDTTSDTGDGSVGTTSTTTGAAETTGAPPTTTQEPTATGPGTETQGSATSVEPTTTDSTMAVDPTTLDTTTLDATTLADTSTTADTTGTDTGGSGDCVPGDSQSCYSGPDGTDGVGECTAGVRQCGDDESWGPCEGEVVPAPETCDEAGDEDCDGVDPCLGDGAYAWGLTFGQGGDDEGEAVAFDGAGNLVLAVWGNGPIDFGGGSLINAGYDVFLAKFSPAGALLWSKRFGDANYQGGPDYGLGATPAGEIVLAGIFNGAIDFGGGPLQNPTPMTDLFLVKLNGEGGHVWSKSFHSGEDAAVVDLALAESGDILLTGAFHTSLDLGGDLLVSNGVYDGFVGKFTAAGAHVWSRGFGGADSQHGLGVDVDASGNSYVTGWFRGTLDPGTGPLVCAGSEDIFLFKLDPAGEALWGRRFGDAGSQDARGVAVDSKGRVTIAGAASGSVDFGGGPLDGPSVLSYLAQFDDDGEHLWSRELCTVGSIAYHVANDGLDNVLVTGNFYDTCDVGGGPLTALDKRDVFVGKFSPKGQHGWSKRLGGVQDQFSGNIDGSAAGVVAVTGDFSGGIDLGAGVEASEGGRDGFVVAFAP